MNQLYYPLEPHQFLNNTNVSDYTTNLQNLYVNIENKVKNKKVDKLVVLKEELFKELTSDNEEIFNEVVQEILDENNEYDDNNENDINDDNINDNEEDNDNSDDNVNDDYEIQETECDLDDFEPEPEIKKNPVKEFRNSLENFKKEFLDLQSKFIVIDKKLKEESKKTDKDIRNLEKMIDFINNLDESYTDTEEMKTIFDNIVELSNKIKSNNNLKSAKRDYVRIRIEMNDCFSIIKSINNLNISNTCSLCLTNKVEIFIDPCGHSFCTNCKDRLIQYEGGITDTNCPTCRGYIRDFKSLYL
tara:strand:+ start:622 stop:1527 length:906 start_codon:yes stop_codon:yes gene_type:complete